MTAHNILNKSRIQVLKFYMDSKIILDKLLNTCTSFESLLNYFRHISPGISPFIDFKEMNNELNVFNSPLNHDDRLVEHGVWSSEEVNVQFDGFYAETNIFISMKNIHRQR